MDSCLIPDWNTEIGVEFPTPIQRKSLGLDSDLMELLWQNGELILHSQTNHRKQSIDECPTKSEQFHKTNHQSTSGATEISDTFIHDEETSSWIGCPIDESFEKEFCANFLSDEILSSIDTPLDDEKIFKFSASEVDDSKLFQPPRFEIQNVPECSVGAIGSSHCASSQVVEKVKSPRSESGQAVASCSGGSGNSNFQKTSSRSNDSNSHKRKNRDVEESECRSDATELESASGNKSRTNRRTRVAEVHNLSERRRRDRINEKMKALQELIPHSNKSDKASMLDEAIEYMKSLKLQLQLMWMGSAMGPMMMLPGPQHYMSRAGIGVGPQMFQNLVRLSRSPLVHQAMNIASMQNQGSMGANPVVGPVNHQNPMHNSSFSEQYANYMGFHSTPNTSQPMNVFNFGFHSSQQSQSPPDNGNGAIG